MLSQEQQDRVLQLQPDIERSIRYHFSNCSQDIIEDLIQEALLKTCQTVQQNPSLPFPDLSRLCLAKARYSCIDYFREKHNIIRIPRSALKKGFKPYDIVSLQDE